MEKSDIDHSTHNDLENVNHVNVEKSDIDNAILNEIKGAAAEAEKVLTLSGIDMKSTSPRRSREICKKGRYASFSAFQR